MSYGTGEIKGKSTEWANLLAGLIDRLIGEGAEVAYNFEKLEIDMPRAVGLQGQELGSAKWVINGKLSITARTQTSDNNSNL
jgi:hypothetical protein